MRTTVTARRDFDGLHQVSGHSVCDRVHGHNWFVEVTLAGGLDPKRILIVDHGELKAYLDRLVDEFAGYDLNDMLPGVITTPEGIALYIRERMILEWPGLVVVSVGSNQGTTAHVSMESR